MKAEENRQGSVPGRGAAGLNAARAAVTGNPQCLHGSGNQSERVINGEGHETRGCFGSSSRARPGSCRRAHTPAPATQKALAFASCTAGTGTGPAPRWLTATSSRPVGAGGLDRCRSLGLAPAFPLALGWKAKAPLGGLDGSREPAPQPSCCRHSRSQRLPRSSRARG